MGSVCSRSVKDDVPHSHNQGRAIAQPLINDGAPQRDAPVAAPRATEPLPSHETIPIANRESEPTPMEVQTVPMHFSLNESEQMSSSKLCHSQIISVPKGSLDDSSEAFGLLLCGSGESGKTTFAKQLKLNFVDGGISNRERKRFVDVIRGNLVETMKILLEWLEKNDRECDLVEEARFIKKENQSDCAFTSDLVDTLKELWDDESIQEAFAHHTETTIPDHMKYFFSKIDELAAMDYLPSNEDLLKARIRTIGINQVTLSLDETHIRIYDVGGQLSERPRWEQLEKDVCGLIFMVSLGDLDRLMFENESTPRIEDAMAVFRDMSHRPKLEQFPIFLIFNKFDAFEIKVRDESIDYFQQAFPEYRGDCHNPEECYQYLANRFLQEANPQIEGRDIILMKQDALNPKEVCQNASEICRYMRDHVK